MRRTYVSLAIGAVLALVAVALLYSYVRNLDGTPAVPLTPVVAVNQDLPFGTVLTAKYLQVVAWPAASVPDGAFASADQIFQNSKGPQDRIVVTPLAKGEPVLKSKISGFGARPIMSARVEEGMRALSIHIDPISGVSGFILPGDHVDILLTRDLGTGDQNKVTDLFMQDVQVLGINQNADQNANKPEVGQTATVEVTPDQAQKLVLAQQAGTLSLTLRGIGAAAQIKAAQITERDLVTGPRRPGAPVAHPPQVRVRYGDGSVVEHTINSLN